jgi:hypothetical protein
MRQAIRKRTGQLVYADYSINKYDQYECPTCGTGVHLRRGTDREPYFAHFSNDVARKDCEEYHEGYSYYRSRVFSHPARTILIAQSKIDLERHNEYTNLHIKESETDVHLYLSIPNIPLKKKSNTTFSELQKIKLHLTADDIHIQQVSIVKLFMTGIKTEFEVKPTEKDYVLKLINDSSINVDLDFLQGSIEGLSPEGNLFCKVDDEWIRILPNTEVEWGEDYYFVAQEQVSVPIECTPEIKGIKKGYSRRWKFWLITLPSEWDYNVETWLDKISYTAVEARWKLQLLSIPQGFDPIEKIYYFDYDSPILFKAISPFPRITTTLICELFGDEEKIDLKSNSENNCFFSVKNKFDKIYLEDYEETEINIEFTNDFGADSLNSKISNLPTLKFRLGNQCFQSSPEIQNEELNIIQLNTSLESNDIEISIHPENLNDFVKHKIDIYLLGDRIISRYSCNYKEARKEILTIIQKEYQGILIIDAGSLGNINLKLQNTITTFTDNPQPIKISNWLSVFASSPGLAEGYIGSNSNIRNLRNNKNLIYNIAHNRSPLVTAQARALSKVKKG